MWRRAVTPGKLPSLRGTAVRATDRSRYGRLEDVAAGAVVKRCVLADVGPLVALALGRGGVRTAVGAAALGKAHSAGELHGYARINGRFANLFLDQVLRSINTPAERDGDRARHTGGVDPSRKRRIRFVVALSAAVLLAGALAYTSFSASSEARTPSQLAGVATPGKTYQLTGKVVAGYRQDG